MVPKVTTNQSSRRDTLRKFGAFLGIYLMYRIYKKTIKRWSNRFKFICGREFGEFNKLVQDLSKDENQELHKLYFRLSKAEFDHILSLIESKITKNLTSSSLIDACQRLAITLRILASGESFSSMFLRYRIPKKTVCQLFHETTKVLWDTLQPLYLAEPTADEWAEIRQRFFLKWNFPNCIGAMDGKHIAIKAPPKSGSSFLNYKGYFSIVLLAIVDADYNFLLVDIGGYGKQSDGATFKYKLYDRLPGTDTILPNVIVADAVFPLKDNLLIPFAGQNLPNDRRIFNYRLSRARRVSENAFGLLGNRFRLFLKEIEMLPENVDNAIKAGVCLHNYINKTRGLTSLDIADDYSNSTLLGKLQHTFSGNRYKEIAMLIRDKFKDYFVSDVGKVSWQDNLLENDQI